MTFSAKFIVAVAYIIVRDGSVLVLRRSPLKDHAPGEWETGSGRVEYGEAPEDAVRREVREETGLQVEIVAPVDTFHFYRGVDREETVGITFGAGMSVAKRYCRTSTIGRNGSRSTEPSSCCATTAPPGQWKSSPAMSEPWGRHELR